MKVLIKKELAGWKPNTILTIDENRPEHYTDVAYWLRRCEEGKIDGYCELLEFAGKEIKKQENMIQSEQKKKKVKNTQVKKEK